MKCFQFLILLVTLNSCNSFSQENEFPKPIGYVSDFEKVFSEDDRKELEILISDYEVKTSKEIAIVTLNFDGDYESFKNYTIDLANAWGVGKKGKDNGLIIVFSPKSRLIRINTGTQTENILTDSICEQSLQNTIIPEFKKGEYFIGIKKGLLELISKWE